MTTMENMFNSASAFNQQLCWKLTGKIITNMFTGSNGASIIVCYVFNDKATLVWVVDETATAATYGVFGQEIGNWNVGSVATMQNMLMYSITNCVGILLARL